MESWNNITGIHGILVFDEAESIHQLHLGDFPGAMGREMGLDVGLGSCAREIAQIEAGRRDLGHVACRCGPSVIRCFAKMGFKSPHESDGRCHIHK